MGIVLLGSQAPRAKVDDGRQSDNFGKLSPDNVTGVIYSPADWRGRLRSEPTMAS